jgi:DNA-binding response OmpR family regulator
VLRSTDIRERRIDDANSARVLLLEPNGGLRSAVADVLTAENYDVRTCSAVNEIVEHAYQLRAEVALIRLDSRKMAPGQGSLPHE